MGESEAGEIYTVLACEGCGCRWRLKHLTKNRVNADLLECPLCDQEQKKHTNAET